MVWGRNEDHFLRIDNTTKTYFANGLLKSIDNGVSKSDYAYSVRNELTSESQTLANQAAKVVSYSYDADGLRSQMTSPAGAPIAYNWTAKTQLKDISRDGPPPLATYGYDAAGRLLTTAHENGITEVKTYNAASELLSNAHSGGGLNPPSQHSYTYDSTGRRTAETRTGILPATNTYGYDSADQVTSADYGNSQTDAYAYDPMGNRTTARSAAVSATPTTYTTNSANQYTSISNLAPPIHDANGNLISQGGVTYTWDSENRLLSTTDGTTTNTFTYDANHRRVTKRTAVNGTVTEKTHFIYDGWNVIEERNNTDTTPGFNLTTFTLSKELTWGTDISGSLQGVGGVGGLLLITDHSAPGTFYYHYDGNGNVTQVTTNTGSTAASYRYDAFGNTLQATGTYAAQNKYRFSTKPIDVEITTAPLYYYGYRYYDPQTGRWPSRDPIGESGGINIYTYVSNRTIDRWDFLGLCDREKECSVKVIFGHGSISKPGKPNTIHTHQSDPNNGASQCDRVGYVGCGASSCNSGNMNNNAGIPNMPKPGVPYPPGINVGDHADPNDGLPDDDAVDALNRAWKAAVSQGVSMCKACKPCCCKLVNIRMEVLPGAVGGNNIQELQDYIKDFSRSVTIVCE